MEPNEFKCAGCGGIFIQGQDEDSAMQELVNRFGPEALKGDLVCLCEDCDIMARAAHELLELFKKYGRPDPLK